MIFAECGSGTIDGAVWRPGDPVKHLGPPEHLSIRLWSRLFSTRCGLGPQDGAWQKVTWSENDDCWCPPCLAQALIGHIVIDTDKDDPGE
jgi:hypothetical protein